MSGEDHRILLHVMMFSGNDSIATKKVNSTYYRLNNILDGNEKLPNISKICDYCENVNKQLGAYIRNKCLDLGKESTIFDPVVKKSSRMIDIIESSERKKIRIILYPGNRNDIDDLNMSETTHNMIVQFNQDKKSFNATEVHTNPPLFYQVCNSEDLALLYLEGLIVDSCLCHYLSVSDVAQHHDDKQRISSDKVVFLKQLAKQETIEFLSEGAQRLVKYVGKQLKDSTPYVSFLSIFTVAPLDLFDKTYSDFSAYCEDYCNLWGEFQKWYFCKYHRVFSKKQKTQNPLDMIFDRNKYQGQISAVEISTKIDNISNNPPAKNFNDPFGIEYRYAVVIIKHIPNNPADYLQLETLFSGQLHQSKWDIVYWGDIEKYNNVLKYLEIVPFMITED